jgi:hypothetical protein
MKLSPPTPGSAGETAMETLCHITSLMATTLKRSRYRSLNVNTRSGNNLCKRSSSASLEPKRSPRHPCSKLLTTDHRPQASLPSCHHLGQTHAKVPCPRFWLHPDQLLLIHKLIRTPGQYPCQDRHPCELLCHLQDPSLNLLCLKKLQSSIMLQCQKR